MNDLRKRVPRSSIAKWTPSKDRDPVGLIAKQEATRLQHLLPIRHERMCESPFRFFRGSAVVMAADLAGVPVTGLRAQLCGDMHIGNFGAYASPERNVVFDVRDFDETLPGPWEWDVLRMAASTVLAARDRQFAGDVATQAVLAGIGAYRHAMLAFGAMSPLQVWYEQADVDSLSDAAVGANRKRVEKHAQRARKRTVERMLPKLTNGTCPTFVDQPPTFVRVRLESAQADEPVQVLNAYRASLPPHVRVLLDRFELRDLAMKVVGVGSVGTRCAVALFLTPRDEPLVLQIKEAEPSVLEAFAGPSAYENCGERVVQGQRLIQTTGDVLLGWTHAHGHDYYVRQLRDMKYTLDLTSVAPEELVRYAGVCGWTLARSHARSGDPAAIAGYLGSGDAFDRSVAAFADTYATLATADFERYRSIAGPGAAAR